MPNYRSFIRGAAALESLTIGLATQQEQIAQNLEIGYTGQADHLTRESRIEEISGAFEYLEEARYPAYRAMFSRTVRAIDFPHRLPELASNDRISAARSLAFAPAMSKGTPAERSNIEIWSTPTGNEHLIVGIVDFGQLGKSYFLISQWSEGKLSTEKDILKAHKARSRPDTKHVVNGHLVIRINLRETRNCIGIGAATLAVVGAFGVGIALAFSSFEKAPTPGPAQRTTAQVCNVIQTARTYVMETSDGVFIQPVYQSHTVKTSNHMKAGGIGGKGSGGSHGGGGGGNKHVQITRNPLPVEGASYNISWQYDGERTVTDMDRTQPTESGCTVQ